MAEIDDPADPRLDPYRRLTDAAARVRADAAAGIVVIEGVLALRRSLAAGWVPSSVLCSPTKATVVGELLRGRPDGAPTVPVLVADRALLAEVCGYDVHRGVLAVAPRPSPLDAADLLRRCRRVAVCEAVGDQENLGAVFRAAAALGLDAVLVDDRCAEVWSRRVVRVSLGWATVVPHARLGGLPAGLGHLEGAGFRTVALSPGGTTAVDVAADGGLLDDPVALCVGAEGPGLTEATATACDARVRIPMAAGVDSLNVGTALAVVAAFAAARRSWDGAG